MKKNTCSYKVFNSYVTWQVLIYAQFFATALLKMQWKCCFHLKMLIIKKRIPFCLKVIFLIIFAVALDKVYRQAIKKLRACKSKKNCSTLVNEPRNNICYVPILYKVVFVLKFQSYVKNILIYQYLKGTDVIYFARKNFSRSLFHKKNFGLIWLVFKLQHLFCWKR